MDLVVVGFGLRRDRDSTILAAFICIAAFPNEAFPAKGKASIVMVIGGPVIAIGPPLYTPLKTPLYTPRRGRVL
jgi:hypothetical protein